MAWGLDPDLTEQDLRVIAGERAEVLDLYHISPSENCSTCHR